jgi:hypothetical protein
MRDQFACQATIPDPFDDDGVIATRLEHHHGSVARVEARQLEQLAAAPQLALDRPESVTPPAVLARTQPDFVGRVSRSFRRHQPIE